MSLAELEALGWPSSRLSEAIAALALRSGITAEASDPANPNDGPEALSATAWIEWKAKRLGCEAESIETTFRDLHSELRSAYPSILRMSDASYLAVLKSKGTKLHVITPRLAVRSVSIDEVCRALREPVERASRTELNKLLEVSEISPTRQSQIVDLLLNEQLGERRFDQCWLLRVPPGATRMRWLRQAAGIRNGIGLLTAHTGQYLLWLASWAILGRLSFEATWIADGFWGGRSCS